MKPTAGAKGIDPRFLVVGAVMLLILVVALASNIDLGGFSNDDEEEQSDAERRQGEGQGAPGPGERVELGPGGGFNIDDSNLGDASIFQDRNGNLTIEFDNGGQVSLVEDPAGTIAGLVIDEEGNISTLEVGETPPDGATVLRPQGNGTTTVERDGEYLGRIGEPGEAGSWEIFRTPGGGIGVRESDGSVTPQGSIGDIDSELGSLPSQDRARNDDGDDDGSGLGGLLKILGLIVLAIAALALAWYGLKAWMNRDIQDEVAEPPSADPQVTQALGAVTSLLDQVRAEPDPRLAIQKAYAAAESGFGTEQLARRPSETAHEHLQRTVGVVDGLETPLRRLVQLFELARFSQHPITSEMRDEAIHTLVTTKATMEAAANTVPPANLAPVPVGTGVPG